ncbi:MAG: FAD-dependent oxidoreductase [Bacilli bacterium]|nr:FAD-dependent oxidoreductase [Bacilli bacterium]
MVDVLIIGGGPAGMGVALNLLRSGRSVLILEKEAFGGQMATSPRIENIPGIKSISGMEYSDQLFEQITDLGAEFELGEVAKIRKTEEGYFEATTSFDTYVAKSVVIATGCSHRQMGLPKEDKFVGKGISYCAVCDGAFYKGKEVSIIGDANTALQYALLLANYCTKVHMYCLFDKLFADQILIDRVLQNDKIDIKFEMNLIEFLGVDQLEGLVFHSNKDNQDYTFKTEAVFIAIGQVPHNEPFKDIVNLSEKGFIITDNNMATREPGIFAIGDCREKGVRQVITALGDASIAAVSVDKYLRTVK